MKSSKGKGKNKDFKEAAGFAAGGGVAGAGIAAMIGNMGLAGGFGAIAVGATPVVGAGVIVGMAAYGIKKLFESKNTPDSIDSLQREGLWMT